MQVNFGRTWRITLKLYGIYFELFGNLGGAASGLRSGRGFSSLIGKARSAIFDNKSEKCPRARTAGV